MSDDDDNNLHRKKKQKVSVATAEKSVSLIYYNKDGKPHETKLIDFIDIFKKNPIEQQDGFNSLGFTVKRNDKFNAVTFKRYLDTNQIDKLKKHFLKTDISLYSRYEMKVARKKFIDFLFGYFKDTDGKCVLNELFEMENGPVLLNAMVDNEFFSFDTFADGIKNFYKKLKNESDIFKNGKMNNFDIMVKIFKKDYKSEITKYGKREQHHSSRKSIITCLFRKFEINIQNIHPNAFFVKCENRANKIFEYLKQLESLGDGFWEIDFQEYSDDVQTFMILFPKLLITYYMILLNIGLIRNEGDYYNTGALENMFRMTGFLVNMMMTLIKKFPAFVLCNLLYYYQTRLLMTRLYLGPLLPHSGSEITTYATKIGRDLTLCKEYNVFNFSNAAAAANNKSNLVYFPTVKTVLIEIEKIDQYATEIIEFEHKLDKDRIEMTPSSFLSISKLIKSHLNCEFSWKVKKILLIQRYKSKRKRLFASLPLDIFKYIFELINGSFFERTLSFSEFPKIK